MSVAPSTAAPTAPFLTAEWRDLLVVNWEIAPDLLEPRVPAGTTLDRYAGRTYVSLVGFRFLATRVLGLAIPGHRDFDEVNLRFYVRRREGDEWRRGVVFVKEIVPRRAIAWVARACYGERYVALPMRHHLARIPSADGGAARGELSYEWRLGDVWHGLAATTLGDPVASSSGSEEEFITEHYWGYVQGRGGSAVEYRVEHPRWRVGRVETARFSCDVAALYGAEFVQTLAGRPTSAFVADGSPVTVRRGRRLARPVPTLDPPPERG